MITDELREWKGSINTRLQPETVLALRSELNCIADRIDAAHERALRESYDCGYASADDWLAQHEDAMADHGWVRLPLDADGEPIRVGDVMEGEKVGGGFGESFEVVGYIMSNGELEPMDEHKCPRKRKYLHRHHTPTVEDVLREFAASVRDQNADFVALLVDEYAKRLRLAEGVDE